MKKVLKVVLKALSFVFVTILGVLMSLMIIMNMFCNGSSKKARELFVTTMLETGNLKFVTSIFLSKKEINDAVKSNSLQAMNAEIDDNLIKVEGSADSNEESVKIEKVVGNSFSGTLITVKDPSSVFLATTYPWSEYGKELGELVKESGAIGGINGGLYVSTANKGGYPIGVVVSKGVIQYNNVGSYKGLYLIGFNTDNLLKIIEVTGMSTGDVEKMIEIEKIRDAITFQDEASDKNNHFVKLIVNGEKRELNGLGSGANPRTVIGQRKDGAVLLLVADGRGANGHLGATASDLIEIMSKYGAVNAANLDGGSSSTMYYNNEYLMTSVTLYYSNSSWKIPTAFVFGGEE